MSERERERLCMFMREKEFWEEEKKKERMSKRVRVPEKACIKLTIKSDSICQ